MKKILPIALLLVSCSAQPTDDTASTVDTSPKVLPTEITSEILDESLRLGTAFMIENQKEIGNFQYAYDIETNEHSNDDSQVRQAGALWGIALLYKQNQTPELRSALEHGFAFFLNNSITLEGGGKLIAYPDQDYGRTGTTALFTLALLEYLYYEDDPTIRAELDMFITGLLSLRRDDGLFYAQHTMKTGEGFAHSSPYFDGETLLALVKAAKEQGYEDLMPIILESADAMHNLYVVQALREQQGSKQTKGYYQWGSMAYYELFTSGFERTEKYALYAIDLAYWMIDVHRTLQRTRNTAYAYEGIISAWELARLTENKEAQEYFESVIHKGLLKLTSWQVGHSLQNEYLHRINNTNPFAVGGILNKKDEPGLRIDVTQHQMHAVLLAKRFLFPGE